MSKPALSPQELADMFTQGMFDRMHDLLACGPLERYGIDDILVHMGLAEQYDDDPGATDATEWAYRNFHSEVAPLYWQRVNAVVKHL